MNCNEFKALNTEEQIRLVNDRLKELKELKLNTKQFKTEILDVSYSFISRILIEKNYRNIKNKFVKVDNKEIDNKKQKKEVGAVTPNKKSNKLNLTNEEIIFLKNFIKINQIVENVDTDRTAETRSFRMYSDDYMKFKDYCKTNKLKVQDALSVALNDFINKNKDD